MASQAELLTSPTITRKKGLWEMRKEELLTEAAARDLPVNTRLTVPELRELIKKDMNAQAMPFTARQGTSLSKLSVEALKQKVIESGQELPVKPTRGALLLLLRDRGDTVIRFGRNRGLMYNQTPISYREWACTEARTSSTASNDLKDFAAWWAETKEEMEIRPSSSTMRNRGGYHDPEEILIVFNLANKQYAFKILVLSVVIKETLVVFNLENRQYAFKILVPNVVIKETLVVFNLENRQYAFKILVPHMVIKETLVVFNLENRQYAFKILVPHMVIKETLVVFNLENRRDAFKTLVLNAVIKETLVVFNLENRQYAFKILVLYFNVKKITAADAPGTIGQRGEMCEQLAKRKLDKKQFEYQDLLEVVKAFPLRPRKRHRDIQQDDGFGVEYVSAGVYTYGNRVGLTETSTTSPCFIKCVNAFMREREPGPWCAFVLQRNVATKMHTDCHNLFGTDVVTLSFGDFTGGEVWVECNEDQTTSPVFRCDDRGVTRCGRLLSSKERPLRLDPKAGAKNCFFDNVVYNGSVDVDPELLASTSGPRATCAG
eukprot:s77_g24.t1